MASKVWKGFLSVGLLNIPVYLNVAARDKKIDMHNYHTACNGPVKEPKYCPSCAKQLQASEIYRGYNAGEKGIIPITDEELDAITPETQRVMEITDCVKWNEIDPIYLAESFYCLPDDAGKKAYALLVRALKDTGRVGIAKLTKSRREHIVIVRPRDNGLMLHYIWHAAEIADVAEFEHLEEPKLQPNEVKLATQLVESMESDFNPKQYEDVYAKNVQQLIASKLDKGIAAPQPIKAVAPAPTQDLMQTLMASLKAPKRKIKLEEEPPVKVAAVAKKKAKKVA
jgi:DNA end-binding protein Ku